MLLKKQFFVLCFLLLCYHISNAQIEIAHVSIKDFKATGFGGFLNFSLPASEADYVTLEGGFQYFSNKDGEEAGLIPVLVGYRYTLDRSGTGLYIEPHAGYNFGGTTIGVYNEYGSPLSDGNGKWLYEKISGATGGLGIGYLFQPGGKIQFNVALRYERGFGSTATNMYSFRISHAFTFGRRSDD